jgi:hypothetical protein
LIFFQITVTVIHGYKLKRILFFWLLYGGDTEPESSQDFSAILNTSCPVEANPIGAGINGSNKGFYSFT